jgi:tRNA G18 (ribose-2'-O)-methylase SpoU
MEKESIQKKNEKIKRAILVSQMQDHKGFKVFIEDLEEVLIEVRNQDIRYVKDLETLYNAQGQVNAIENLKYYFESQKNWALKPMVDENTGEEEILNNKNN